MKKGNYSLVAIGGGSSNGPIEKFRFQEGWEGFDKNPGI